MGNRGGIRRILDHSNRILAMNGQERNCMHLLIQFENCNELEVMEEGKTHGWEPLSWIYHDQPQLVQNYFASINQDFIQYLSNSQKKKHNLNRNNLHD